MSVTSFMRAPSPAAAPEVRPYFGPRNRDHPGMYAECAACRRRVLRIHARAGRPAGHVMKLQKVSLTDYRGFRSLELDLDPDVTVLVGVNGAGKTSILDAIAALMSRVHAWVGEDWGAWIDLGAKDRREGSGGATVSGTARLLGTDVTWPVVPARPGRVHLDGSDMSGHFGSPRDAASGFGHALDAVATDLERGAALLPLAVYFPTNRSAVDVPERIKNPQRFDPLSAYDGALSGGSSNFRGFFEWFRSEEDVYNEQRGRSVSQADASKLPLVREAIEKLLAGSSDLRIERRPQRMMLAYKGEQLDITQLSDGEKGLIALAGDLARRLVLAAPTASKPLEHPAIVLIDEVELHLHPGLQRTILPRLREVFPGCQFIVTTHSPQVLSSVRSANVRLLNDFKLQLLDRGTWRRDTNMILESVFGDPGRPPDVAKKLNALRDAVDEDRPDDARRMVNELQAMIEGEDADVTFYEQLLPPLSEKGAAQ
jgi:energy-coupling factor transporter ATP-binding protein EcfA2